VTSQAAETETLTEEDILNDIIGDVTDITCASVEEELRGAECVENLTDFAACLEEAEAYAKKLLKEIQKLQKKLVRLRKV
jgi:hypothetical protein